MGTRVSYRLDDSVATITMDDGKANAVSPSMLAELNDALDQAAADRAVVVLTGTDRTLSAGFDLRVLAAGGTEATTMIRGGFELSARLLSFPTPVVVACGGHAIAMGAFLLLSGDYRIGAAGSYKITANEVAIGITMPRSAVAICRQRLAPAHLNRAVALAEVYSAEEAVAAGFLDRVVPAPELSGAAHDAAARLAALDLDAHAASKLRLRESALTTIRAAIETDAAELQLRAHSPR